MRRKVAILFCGFLLACAARAEEADKPEETYSLHGQSTLISQYHGGFPQAYSGTNSLVARREIKTSFTATLFAGARLWSGGEIYLNPELAQGRGLSGVLGVAGFTNGEIARVSSPDLTLYRARLFFRQTFGLGGNREYVEADQNQLAGYQDGSRLVLTVGNFSALDIFDDNSYSHEPRSQFINWALLTNGAWDFPADARGYTNGVALELINPGWALRGGLLMEPREANGLPLDNRFSKAHGGVVELERSYALQDRPGKVRLLAYANRANMGSYRAALAASPIGPDITQTRRLSTKRGGGLNVEQQLADDLGAFLRAGWNDGKTESWAFTEIDRTLSGGISLKGARWGRANDVLGVAGIVNGLSNDHRDYLAAGGYGFIVGDGQLNYGRESILESYYSLAVVKGLSLSLDYQYIQNPAYNKDRGPVSVWSSRIHYEF